jgi:hypothetical protein
MPLCSACTVDNADPRCGRETRVCYRCCVDKTISLACVHHHNIAPPAKQAEIVAAAVAAASAGAPVNALLLPPPGAPAPMHVRAVVQDGLPAPPQAPLQQPGAAAPALNDLSTIVAQMAAQLVTLTAQVAALAARPSVPASDPIAPVAPAAAPVSPIALVQPIAAPQVAAPQANASAVDSAPHREALLGAIAAGGADATDAFLNRMMASVNGPSAADREVSNIRTSQTAASVTGPFSPTYDQPPPLRSTSLHKASVVFPPFLAPPPLSGSVVEQTLTSTGLRTTTSSFLDTTKIKSVDDLRVLLDSWYCLAVDSEWTALHVSAIVRYRAHLIENIAVKSLEAALRYHLLLARAVDSGRHNFFKEDGHYHDVSMSLVRDSYDLSKRSSSSGAGRTGARTSGSKAGPKKPVYPAGSCAHHPQSTTHTTAQCNKGASTSATTASTTTPAARPAQ